MPHTMLMIKASIAISCLVFLSACSQGGSGGTTLTTPTPTPGGTPAPNAAPTITGQPVPDVRIHEAYSFQPAASDPNGKALIFSVSNLPGWASFDSTSGKLSGTPGDADIGTYRGVTISVSNGTSSAALSPFTITVNQISLGSATLTWVAPTQNTDGSVLTDLAGFQIRFGRSAANLTDMISLNNPSVSRYVIGNLSSGTWFFAILALNSKGVQSSSSGISSMIIG